MPFYTDYSYGWTYFGIHQLVQSLMSYSKYQLMSQIIIKYLNIYIE